MIIPNKKSIQRWDNLINYHKWYLNWKEMDCKEKREYIKLKTGLSSSD